MIYVVDTHVVIWLTNGLERRFGKKSARVLGRFADGADAFVLSAASLMELAMLEERGKVRFLGGWHGFRERIAQMRGVTLEPITPGDVDHARGLTPLVDPFDRLIAATALRLGVKLITADERIAASGLVPVLW